MRKEQLIGDLGNWSFYEGEWTWKGESKQVFTFGPKNEFKPSNEWYNTLEHAMAAAIAEKFTGPRGAGGSGVGTAADWFIKMIGADK